MSSPTNTTPDPRDEYSALFDALCAMSGSAAVDAIDTMDKLQRSLGVHQGNLYLQAGDLQWAVLKLRQIAKRYGLIAPDR